MTYRELLAAKHPNEVREEYIGGCLGCPQRMGYEEKPWCEDESGANDAMCTMCWNREVEGQIDNL